jgi:ABC-type sugar transport system substrate-binding protein
MSRSSRLAASAALALALAAILACGGSGRRTPEPARPAAPRLGVVLMQQDQFFRLNEAGMREAAARLGVELRVQNAAGALDKEVNLVETFATQGVGAILVSPLSSEGSVPALRRAHEAGIRVVTYNNALAADFPAFSIASDQTSLGATTGAAATEWIERARGGSARVALIGFASQLPEQGGARQRGFKDVITTLPGVQVVAEQDAWEAAQATTAVTELLAKQPDLVWAANEGGTVGATTAVRNAGLQGTVVVFGTDISSQLVDFMLAEDGILQAVTAQAPVDMGRTAVEAAVKVIRGEPVERQVVLPGKLFTRDRPDELRAERERLEAAR